MFNLQNDEKQHYKNRGKGICYYNCEQNENNTTE